MYEKIPPTKTVTSEFKTQNIQHVIDLICLQIKKFLALTGNNIRKSTNVELMVVPSIASLSKFHTFDNL